MTEPCMDLNLLLMKRQNLFSPLPDVVPQEIFDTLLCTDHLRVERIISAGQATPPGEWYDQDTPEWVILLSGSAGLRFEGEPEVFVLQPGDYLLIPAHQRHRVEWTDNAHKTVWLAVHYREEITR
jgi:cupin 2 domain-containing protein